MIETSKKQGKNATVSSSQTVAKRGLINANWQKLLTSNLIADVKDERPPPKDHFTGTFRRSRKKNKKISDHLSQSDNVKDETFCSKSELIDKKTVDIPKHNKNKLTKYLAMDCEMVGIGYEGNDHMLARISIVNKFGDCIYDKYVKPREEVKDYRTEISGVRKEDLLTGEEFTVVQKEVSELLRGRILVGHSLKNDLAVLFLSHPKRSIRDTSKYKPFKKITKGRTPSLKQLAKEILGINIQDGEHSSVEDARAAMQLYCTVAKSWESGLYTKRGYRKISEE